MNRPADIDDLVARARGHALGDLLHRTAARMPHKLALVNGDLRWTFAELDERASRFANLLLQHGVQPGTHVAVHSPNRIEWVDALHAIAAVEEWYENLFTVTAMISAGEFQNDVDKMEQWIAARGGSVTKTALYHNFRNMIQKDPRELDSRVNFLVESGRVNRKEEGGKPPKFLLNGG